jgi:hypothetical protein
LINVTITPTDSTLEEIVSSLELMSSKFMPKTYRAFKTAASLLSYTWKSYALGAPIPGSAHRLKRPKGTYARSIKVRFLSPFNYVIFSDNPVAKYLEYGTREYDMKETHTKGRKSRVSKDGDPYLIVPFRHGVPGSLSYSVLPEVLYARLRQMIRNDELTLSQRTGGRKKSPNFKGELIPRGKYQWGSRAKIGEAGFERFEGLVAMNIPSGKEKGHSAYMTFRVISAGKSPAMKWIVKARPAMNITKHVVENTKEIIQEIITAGIKQDLGVGK